METVHSRQRSQSRKLDVLQYLSSVQELKTDVQPKRAFIEAKVIDLYAELVLEQLIWRVTNSIQADSRQAVIWTQATRVKKLEDTIRKLTVLVMNLYNQHIEWELK